MGESKEVWRKDGDGVGGPGIDDNNTCLKCISQQPWGLMMEVIGTQLSQSERS